MVNNNRFYGLDAIRGVAILLVLLRHSWPEIFGGAGIVGVVVFFALSGYLITGLLMRDIKQYGRVRYGRFYLHRAFRLIPALAFMLAGFSAIEGIWNVLGDRDEIVRSVIVGMTYTMNIPGFGHGSDALSHLWTLATEEQFYLAWPVLLLLGMKHWGPRKTVALAAVANLAIVAATIWVATPEIVKVYTLPTSWSAAMLIGAWARIEHDRLAVWFSRASSRIVSGCVAAIILALLCFVPDPKAWPATYLLGGPLIAVCAVSLVFAFGRVRAAAPAGLKPLVWLGTVSYAAYLWNYPITKWVANDWAAIALTILAATVSWWMVERPAARIRIRFEARQHQVGVNRVLSPGEKNLSSEGLGRSN